MKRFKNILIAVVFAAMLLAMLSGAAGDENCDFGELGLDGVMRQYMSEHGLNEENFAMGWYDLKTGDSWYYGEDRFMVGGSMYKLPLNMALSDLIAAGEIEDTDDIERLRMASIVYSDNEAAQSLRMLISQNNKLYRNAMASYSGYEMDELPSEFYLDNEFSPRFMINTLLHLYEDSDFYADIIGWMKRASPDAYFGLERDDFEIAHKYGSFEGALCDCGIIYTERPFLLVVMTQNVSCNERILSEVCKKLADYSAFLDARDEYELTASTAAPETPQPTPPHEATETEPERDPRGGAALLYVPAALVLLAAVLTLLSVRRKKLRLPALVLLAAAAAAVMLLRFGADGAAPEEAPPPTPSIQTPAPTPTPTSAPTPTPTPVSEPTPAPTPEPEKNEWVISFAGDCTVGTLHEWQGMKNRSNMLYVMGADMGYPFRNTSVYFENDDFTVVNLEGALTDEAEARAKDYRFRAPPGYAEALRLGGIDAVSLANNHSGDYYEQGLEDTRIALDGQEILWADGESTFVTELDGGLRLGAAAFNCVEIDLAVGDVSGYVKRIEPLYEQISDCDVKVMFVHWGWEYRTEPEKWMRELGHRLADMGFELVIGSHAHVLQEQENYNGVPIFYSLGNFCYGGHSNPDDKDSVIVRQHIVRTAADFALGETELVPCSISSDSAVNDFCPTPYEPGSAEYDRVLQKLGVK